MPQRKVIRQHQQGLRDLQVNPPRIHLGALHRHDVCQANSQGIHNPSLLRNMLTAINLHKNDGAGVQKGYAERFPPPDYPRGGRMLILPHLQIAKRQKKRVPCHHPLGHDSGWETQTQAPRGKTTFPLFTTQKACVFRKFGVQGP